MGGHCQVGAIPSWSIEAMLPVTRPSCLGVGVHSRTNQTQLSGNHEGCRLCPRSLLNSLEMDLPSDAFTVVTKL